MKIWKTTRPRVIVMTTWPVLPRPASLSASTALAREATQAGTQAYGALEHFEKESGIDRRTVAAADAASPLRPAVAPPRRAIRFENVRFRYSASSPDVLCDLDLELPAGRSTQLNDIDGSTESRAEISARPVYPRSVRSP